MKRIAIFLSFAAVVCAADFTAGQAARLVIGQPTFTAQDSNSSDTILGGASGLAYAADTLFVADSNRVGASPSNHRVLLFQNLSGMLPRPTDALDLQQQVPGLRRPGHAGAGPAGFHHHHRESRGHAAPRCACPRRWPPTASTWWWPIPTTTAC